MKKIKSRPPKQGSVNFVTEHYGSDVSIILVSKKTDASKIFRDAFSVIEHRMKRFLSKFCLIKLNLIIRLDGRENLDQGGKNKKQGENIHYQIAVDLVHLL